MSAFRQTAAVLLPWLQQPIQRDPDDCFLCIAAHAVRRSYTKADMKRGKVADRRRNQQRVCFWMSFRLGGAPPNGGLCEGFRMPAHRDGPACTGAGVRKRPEKETAGRGTYERAAGATAIHCRAHPAFVEACGNERAGAAA